MSIAGRRTDKSFRFAAFELRSDTGELCKHGTRLKLQIKPLQILETLLERPGELITREELCAKLWPPGTFVDFESGLNTAINRLRTALGDSAENPRYIETLPRLGYRFICPVEASGGGRSLTRDVDSGSALALDLLDPSEQRLSHQPSARFVAIGSGRRQASIPLVAVCGLAAGLLVFASLRISALHGSEERFSPVSLQGEAVIAARFLAGSRIAYSTNLDGERHTFVADANGSNSYALPGLGTLAAASDRGEFAIASNDRLRPERPLQLLRYSVSGNRTEALAENVSAADWSPDGKQLALVRQSGGESFVEYPKDNVIYRSQGWIDGVRISRNGRDIAFLEHPVHDDDAGYVRVVTCAGIPVLTSKEWGSAAGLAWSGSGKEVWFTASDESANRALYAVTRSGKVRKLSSEPQSLRLLDVSRSGRALLAIDHLRMTMRSAVSADAAERDISQFDFSHIDDISQNGNVLLFTEAGDAGGQHYLAFVYNQQTHNVKRLGPGRGLALSFDGSQALTVDPQDRTALNVIDVSSGRATRVPQSGFRYQWARFFQPGRLLVGGAYPSQPLTICILEKSSGKLDAVPDAPYLDYVAISPDGRKIAGQLTGKTELFDLATRTTHRLLAASPALPVVWSADSENLFLISATHPNYSIFKLNVATEKSAAWRTIAPRNIDGFLGVAAIVAAPASGAYAYSASLESSRLYLVHGIS